MSGRGAEMGPACSVGQARALPSKALSIADGSRESARRPRLDWDGVAPSDRRSRSRDHVVSIVWKNSNGRGALPPRKHLAENGRWALIRDVRFVETVPAPR